MKLFLIGGGDIKEEEVFEIDKRIVLESGSSPSILIIPWTSSDPKKLEEYGKIMTSYFHKLGAKEVVFASLSESLEDLETKIKKADLIYLPGGNTEYLIKSVKEKGVTPAFSS